MAAAGAGRLRRAASALLLRSPRLPARELSAPARLYHKKVGADEGMRGTRTGKGTGGLGPPGGPRYAGAQWRPDLGRSGRGMVRGLGSPHCCGDRDHPLTRLTGLGFLRCSDKTNRCPWAPLLAAISCLKTQQPRKEGLL